MAVVWAVDNQRDGYDRVVAAGAAVGLGGPDLARNVGAVAQLRTALTDAAVRADLVRAGRQVVDGLGAWRVVRTWEQVLRVGSLPAVADVALLARRATLEDSRLLWEWRNDPGTRAGSRNTDMVPWSQHLAWLEASLTRTDRLLLVVDDEVSPVGAVRWDLESESESEGEWEASITVAPDRRGQSLARPLLRAGEVALAELAGSSRTDVTAYLAVVHVDNVPSLRLFESTGYLPDLPPDSRGFMWFRKAARVT
jgi:ribosomal protein S18 acetylase RimI-like enzyme